MSTHKSARRSTHTDLHTRACACLCTSLCTCLYTCLCTCLCTRQQEIDNVRLSVYAAMGVWHMAAWAGLGYHRYMSVAFVLSFVALFIVAKCKPVRDMCLDMRSSIRVDMCLDVCPGMCLDVRTGMCLDMCIGMCIEVRLRHLLREASVHSGRQQASTRCRL